MANMDLLWQIQKHNDTLDNIKVNLVKVKENIKIKAMGKRLMQSEKRLNDLGKAIKDNEDKLNKDDGVLRDYDYQLQTIEKDLYGGIITDLKQLGFLDEERKALMKSIETKELEILAQMEEMERLKNQHTGLLRDFKDLKKEYYMLMKDCTKLLKGYKLETENAKLGIDRIKSKIDKAAYEKYEKIRRSKNDAIVQVIDKRCNGCNMVLSTFILDRLKNYDEMVFCENCGRILYLEK